MKYIVKSCMDFREKILYRIESDLTWTCKICFLFPDRSEEFEIFLYQYSSLEITKSYYENENKKQNFLRSKSIIQKRFLDSRKSSTSSYARISYIKNNRFIRINLKNSNKNILINSHQFFALVLKYIKKIKNI